ncbi:hypothetical protein DXG01_000601, partial [Tephrocybe rancida]
AQEVECKEVQEQTPEEYKNAMDNLPAILKATLKPTVDTTGWVFFIAAAGPWPDDKGELHVET